MLEHFPKVMFCLAAFGEYICIPDAAREMDGTRTWMVGVG